MRNFQLFGLLFVLCAPFYLSGCGGTNGSKTAIQSTLGYGYGRAGNNNSALPFSNGNQTYQANHYGSISSNDAQGFNNGLQALVAATNGQIGNVNNQPTNAASGVFFSGTVSVSGASQTINRTSSEFIMLIYDDQSSTSGPFYIDIVGISNVSIQGSSISLTFSDNNRSITLNGVWGQNGYYTGTISIQTSNASGVLGNFQIPTQSFFTTQ